MSSSRPQRGAARNAARLTSRYAKDEHDNDEEEEEDDMSQVAQGSSSSHRNGGMEDGTAAAKAGGGRSIGIDDEDGGADDDEDDQEEAQDEEDDDDDYARLQGAVARHRQVAALAGGGVFHSPAPVRRAPSGRPVAQKPLHKRISKARIEAIENVIPPDAGDNGWLPPAASPNEAAAMFAFMLQTIKDFRIANRRCAAVLERDAKDERFRAVSDRPISLHDVQARLTRGEYASVHAFDVDMCYVFETFRRGYPLATWEHGDVCALQRLYQRMTRSHPSAKTSSLRYLQDNLNSGDPRHLYSTVSFGPGQAQRGQNTDLTTRPVIKGKVYFTHAYHKGVLYKVGDWVHLMNPGDPSRPTLAQIFKICKREDERDEPPLLSCCWYFRPEQTVHAPSRRFVAEEVLKTGLFADHSVDDVLEPVYVLFYTKWNKGRPAKNVWDPRAPLYYCEARYNEKTYEFNKIKNWNSCLPEELRGSEPPLHLFPEPLPQPTRIASPFLRGIMGPGRLCEESDTPQTGSPAPRDGPIPDLFGDQSHKKHRAEVAHNVPPMGRGGPTQMYPGPIGGGTPMGYGPASFRPPPGGGSPTQLNGSMQQQALQNAHKVMQDVAISLPRQIGKGEYNRIYQLFSNGNAMSVDLHAVSQGVRGVVGVPTLSRFRDAIQTIASANGMPQGSRMPMPARDAGMTPAGPPGPQRYPMEQPIYAPPVRPGPARPPTLPPQGKAPAVERKIEAALAGIPAYWAPLPPKTVNKFASPVTRTSQSPAKAADESPVAATAAVRWFSCPPVDRPKKKSPTHSLDYLAHRAAMKKRKLGPQETETGRSKSDAESEQEASLLREMKAAYDEVATASKESASWSSNFAASASRTDDPRTQRLAFLTAAPRV